MNRVLILINELNEDSLKFLSAVVHVNGVLEEERKSFQTSSSEWYPVL